MQRCRLRSTASGTTRFGHPRNSFGPDTFFTVNGEEPDGEGDVDVTFKGLWDDTNLYVFIEVTDDELIVDEPCNWDVDSVEVYLDAQDLDVGRLPTCQQP